MIVENNYRNDVDTHPPRRYNVVMKNANDAFDELTLPDDDDAKIDCTIELAPLVTCRVFDTTHKPSLRIVVKRDAEPQPTAAELYAFADDLLNTIVAECYNDDVCATTCTMRAAHHADNHEFADVVFEMNVTDYLT